MKRSIILFALVCSISSFQNSYASGRKPSALPLPSSQGEQMLGTVWRPGMPQANSPKYVSVVGLCRNSYRERAHTQCLNPSSVGSIEAASSLRQAGAALVLSP